MSFGTASIVFLLLNAACAFLVPKLVNVETYGIFKLFLLYGGYVGALHLGSLDGALVRWAKRPQELIPQEFPSALLLALSGCTLAVIAFSLIGLRFAGQNLSRDFLIALIMFAFASNALTAAQFALQASKQFVSLSALSVLQPALLLVCILVLKALGEITVSHLLASYVASYLVVLIFHFLALPAVNGWRPTISTLLQLSRFYYRNGIFILLSNLGLNLVLGLDRLFLSARFSLREFAVYSFASSIFFSVCLVIQSVSKVLFPYVSQNDGNVEQGKSFLCAQRAVLAVWAIGLTVFFPLGWLVRLLLPAYLGAIPVLRITLLGLGAAAVTQIVHANYFRAFAGERRMLVGTAVALATFIVALWLVSPLHSLTAVAWVAVAAHVTWWLTNESLLWSNTDRTVRSSLHDLLSIAIVAGIFLYSAQNVTALRAAIYLAFSVLGTVFVLGPKTIMTVAERYVFATEGDL
jgi:O-antigen/teichoic acid export membrane protein